MQSVNKIILVGTVGRDPDVQLNTRLRDPEVPFNTHIAHVSLATLRTVRHPEGEFIEERTEWHRLVFRGEKLVAKVEGYLRKGDRIYVEGRMEYGSFEKNGITIPTAEVIVTEMVMLGGVR